MRLFDNLYVPSGKHVKRAILCHPCFTRARVLSVYDGDTMTIARKSSIWWNSKVYLYKIRLIGINCPELRGKSEEEKFYAIQAKEFVEELVLNKKVKLDIQGYDKYGRLLASVYCNKTDVSSRLLDIGLAVPYDGKTKVEVNWKELYSKKNRISMIQAIK